MDRRLPRKDEVLAWDATAGRLPSPDPAEVLALSPRCKAYASAATVDTLFLEGDTHRLGGGC